MILFNLKGKENVCLALNEVGVIRKRRLLLPIPSKLFSPKKGLKRRF